MDLILYYFYVIYNYVLFFYYYFYVKKKKNLKSVLNFKKKNLILNFLGLNI